MNDYIAERNARYISIIKTLKKDCKNVRFLYTDTGRVTHIALDETTICTTAARLLISRWTHEVEDICKMCNECMRNVFYLNKKIKNWSPPKNGVSWRCTATVKKRGAKKKLSRCQNTMNGPLDSFCTQHKKCITKYIHKYISVSSDVLQLIYNKL